MVKSQTPWDHSTLNSFRSMKSLSHYMVAGHQQEFSSITRHIILSLKISKKWSKIWIVIHFIWILLFIIMVFFLCASHPPGSDLYGLRSNGSFDRFLSLQLQEGILQYYLKLISMIKWFEKRDRIYEHSGLSWYHGALFFIIYLFNISFIPYVQFCIVALFKASVGTS